MLEPGNPSFPDSLYYRTTFPVQWQSRLLGTVSRSQRNRKILVNSRLDKWQDVVGLSWWHTYVGTLELRATAVATACTSNPINLCGESAHIPIFQARRTTFKVKRTFSHSSHLRLLQRYHDPLNTHLQIPDVVSFRLMKFFYHLGSLLQHPLLWVFSGHRPSRGHRWRRRLGGEECHFWKGKGNWSATLCAKAGLLNSWSWKEHSPWEPKASRLSTIRKSDPTRHF